MKYLSTCYRYSLDIFTVITPYQVIFEYGVNSKSSKPHIRHYAKKWTICSRFKTDIFCILNMYVLYMVFASIQLLAALKTFNMGFTIIKKTVDAVTATTKYKMWITRSFMLCLISIHIQKGTFFLMECMHEKSPKCLFCSQMAFLFV